MLIHFNLQNAFFNLNVQFLKIFIFLLLFIIIINKNMLNNFDLISFYVFIFIFLFTIHTETITSFIHFPMFLFWYDIFSQRRKFPKQTFEYLLIQKHFICSTWNLQKKTYFDLRQSQSVFMLIHSFFSILIFVFFHFYSLS